MPMLKYMTVFGVSLVLVWCVVLKGGLGIVSTYRLQ